MHFDGLTFVIKTDEKWSIDDVSGRKKTFLIGHYRNRETNDSVIDIEIVLGPLFNDTFVLL